MHMLIEEVRDARSRWTMISVQMYGYRTVLEHLHRERNLAFRVHLRLLDDTFRRWSELEISAARPDADLAVCVHMAEKIFRDVADTFQLLTTTLTLAQALASPAPPQPHLPRFLGMRDRMYM